MTCEPTQTPDDIDIPALREKYRQEREKRLRPEGQQQYVRTVGAFADQYETDPHMPVVPRKPISEDLDVAILGVVPTFYDVRYKIAREAVAALEAHFGDRCLPPIRVNTKLREAPRQPRLAAWASALSNQLASSS